MKMHEDAIRELCVITTRDESGRHFTSTRRHYLELESAGLIEITRPVHQPTGIQYDQAYWIVEVTPAGQDVVDAAPELYPGV